MKRSSRYALMMLLVLSSESIRATAEKTISSEPLNTGPRRTVVPPELSTSTQSLPRRKSHSFSNHSSHPGLQQSGFVPTLRRLQKSLWIAGQKTIIRLRKTAGLENIITACQWVLVGYLCVEVVRAVRQVSKEFLQELEATDTSSLGGALLTPTSAKELATWLDRPPNERGATPRGVPAWIIGLARDLKAASRGRPPHELQRILATLTKQQATLLQSCLLLPNEVDSFDYIGGLNNVKESMRSWINTHCHRTGRLRKPTPFERLVNQSKQGMVLWGAPGCGKSLLIKAMAREAGWPTLVITPSVLQRKWYGDSTNQVRTLFSLVSTLGPTIIVLDELDGLFRSRSKEEHEVSRELKTEWLQWWDGVASSQLSSKSQVLVVGATNRPWDVDPAVWRRLPQRFYVGVPPWEDRRDLWIKWAKKYSLPPMSSSALDFLADHTEGYTPSDLFQVLQTACQLGPMTRDKGDFSLGQPSDKIILDEDVQAALQSVQPTRFPLVYIQQLQSMFSPQAWQQGQAQPQQPMYDGANNAVVPGMNDPTRQDTSFGVNGENPSGHVWRTPAGNFYQYHIPVQPYVMEVLQSMWLDQHQWEPSSDEEGDDFLDDSIYEEESEDDL